MTDKNVKDDLSLKWMKVCFGVLALLFLGLQVSVLYLLWLDKNSEFKRDNGDKILKVEKRTLVKCMRVGTRPITDSLEIPGLIQPWVSIDMSAEIAGKIIKLEPSKGEHVKQGQLLIELDKRTYEAEAKKAESDLRQAKLRMERITRLHQLNSVARKELEDAENEKVLAESDLTIAKTNLERCEIRSPIEGILDQFPVELGEYLNVDEEVATIVQTIKVKLVFAVPEKDVSFVKLGDKIDFQAFCLKEKSFSGEVIYISEAATNSLSYLVEVEVDNSNHSLRPGMVCKVKLHRRSIPNAIMAPLTAIIPRFGGYYVFVAGDDGKCHLREIKLGLISGFEALVLEGISPGDKLIVKGQRLLSDNELIVEAPDSGVKPNEQIKDSKNKPLKTTK